MKDLIFNIGSINNSMKQLFWSFALCREKSMFANSGTQRLTEEQLGIEVSHSVYEERYCMLAEPAEEISEEKRQEIIDALDEQFKQVNEKYYKYRRWGMLNRPEVLLLKEKTYWDYREFLRNKGVVLNQIKPVTVINSKERRDFFFSHVITENSSAVESWKNTEEIE